jgi:predicted nucleotidyltransferase
MSPPAIKIRNTTRLREEIFDLIGLHADHIDLVPVGSIERSPGKVVRVKDER